MSKKSVQAPAVDGFSPEHIVALGKGLAKGESFDAMIDQIIDLAVSQTSERIQRVLAEKVDKLRSSNNIAIRISLVAAILVIAGKELKANAAKNARSEYGKSIEAGEAAYRQLAAGLIALTGGEQVPAYSGSELERGRDILNQLHPNEKLAVPGGADSKQKTALNRKLSTLLGSSMMRQALGEAHNMPVTSTQERDAKDDVILSPIVSTRGVLRRNFGQVCPKTHEISPLSIKHARRRALEDLEAGYSNVQGSTVDEYVTNAIGRCREVARLNGKLKKSDAKVSRPKLGRNGEVVRKGKRPVFESVQPKIGLTQLYQNVANALLQQFGSTEKVAEYFKTALVSPQPGNKQNKPAPIDFQRAVLGACKKIEAAAQQQ